MPAIFTVTFNPCIDVNTNVASLKPEIKLQCTDILVQPGGGGINVARAITKLGGHAVALFPSGGDNGRKLKILLAKENVGFISVGISGDTRQNLIVADQSSGLQYRFNMPGPQLDEPACQQLLSVLREQPQLDYLVVSGSLAPGVSPDIFEDLTAIARQKKAMLVVDTSGAALKRAVACGADLVKLSVHELASITGGKDLSSFTEIEAAAVRIMTHGTQVVVVSVGPKGALWVSDGYSSRLDTPATKPVSTVGAGDSMVAGIVWSLSMGKHLSEAVEYGVACGTAATMHPGTSLCNKEDVAGILAKMKKTSNVTSFQNNYSAI